MREAIGLVLACSFAACLAAPLAAARERLLMDEGWRFRLGETEDARILPHGTPVTQWRCKPVETEQDKAPATAAPDLRTDGPDWQDAAPRQDVFRGRLGFVWFRTTLPDVAGPGRLLYFEGVDDRGRVYLNGRELTYHDGWDEPFEVALDPAWREGGPNELAVLVENTDGPGGIWEAVVIGADSEGVAEGPAAVAHDDREWRLVDLPHDFVVEGRFDPAADRSHGYLPKGIGWYRRAFTLPAADRSKRIWLEFDGVYRDSAAWLNGRRLGRHLSGYTSFYYDVTDLVRFGERNLLAVRVDCTRNEGWWYEGGGIYRHVWLTKLDPLHVDHWGVFVAPSVADPGDGRQADAEIKIQTALVNASDRQTACELRSEVQDADGKTVASVSSRATLGAGATEEVAQQVAVSAATLWSLEDPYLYRLVTTVEERGRVTDRAETPFGIRAIRFDAELGFFLNGRPVKIQGTCNHQDFAGVGVALPDRLHAYKIERLKEMGANGYRCAHHPPAPEILDACDRLGMLVMDENRHLGSSQDTLLQVESMVRRDRNHPSVVIWSLCNEEGKQGTPEGQRAGEAMMEVIRRFDPTRPITAAMNGGFGEGLSHIVDVQGFNYNTHVYDEYHQAHPEHPCIATETASILTTRGIYQSDGARAHVSSYTDGAERAWRPVAERPFMAGGFVWTGFDYRGEPTPYDWPCISSHFGILDTCGFPKDDYWYYQAWWSDQTVLHLMPHWNWAYRQGTEVEVRCYSNCDRVELLVNGESQGAQDVQPLSHLTWKVKWAPGVLSARGFRDGREVATTQVETAGAPSAVTLSPDRDRLRADGRDVALVTVAIVDPAGRTVPVADNDVSFEVSPNARILGVGNGSPGSLEPDKATRRRAFNGLCLVLVQTTAQAGPIRLSATSPGLAPAAVTIQAEECPPTPTVPVE